MCKSNWVKFQTLFSFSWLEVKSNLNELVARHIAFLRGQEDSTGREACSAILSIPRYAASSNVAITTCRKGGNTTCTNTTSSAASPLWPLPPTPPPPVLQWRHHQNIGGCNSVASQALSIFPADIMILSTFFNPNKCSNNTISKRGVNTITEPSLDPVHCSIWFVFYLKMKGLLCVGGLWSVI